MKGKLIYEDLTYKVRGAIFKVYNELGYGHKENVYSNSLSIEFAKQNIVFNREKKLQVKYNKQVVGFYQPDFIVDNKVILEIKSLDVIPLSLEKQLIYYLKGTNYRLGLLVNFGNDKVVIKRKIWG